MRGDINPAAICVKLADHKRNGTPWENAWRDARRPHRCGGLPKPCPCVYCFLERHFRAAYLDMASPEGTCHFPEPDASRAPVTEQHEAPRDFARCRSGDGCDQPAEVGRFGRRWCKRHGAELERLSVTLGNVARMQHDQFGRVVPKAA